MCIYIIWNFWNHQMAVSATADWSWRQVIHFLMEPPVFPFTCHLFPRHPHVHTCVDAFGFAVFKPCRLCSENYRAVQNNFLTWFMFHHFSTFKLRTTLRSKWVCLKIGYPKFKWIVYSHYPSLSQWKLSHLEGIPHFRHTQKSSQIHSSLVTIASHYLRWLNHDKIWMLIFRQAQM